jgi:hypothetical protein
VPLHIVYFIDFGRNEKTALPHNTDLHVASLCCWGKAVFLFCEKAHSFSIFREKSAFTFDFSETGNLLCPNRAKIFSFLAVQNPAPERGAIMRKQIQKERCTKIKLEKCPRVCCLYDKVQLAAARMLNADPSVIQIECNIPLSPDDIPADDLNLPSETYTTDFVIHFSDGKIAVREAVFRSHLSRPSIAERLELSRRYWQQQGIDDWGIIIDKECTQNEAE